MYHKTYAKAKKYVETGDILFVMGNNDLLVNSIQKFSDVIIQKSIKEGFCLSVTEALWKETPVVASNVGGIPLQIVDGESGFLLEPQDIEGFADRIVHILNNPDHAKDIGQKAREKVRKEFLITRLLSDHLDMYNAVINQKS
jgi:trehalose synthase